MREEIEKLFEEMLELVRPGFDTPNTLEYVNELRENYRQRLKEILDKHPQNAWEKLSTSIEDIRKAQINVSFIPVVKS